MVWLKRIGIALIALLTLGGVAFWYYVVDGAVPMVTSYQADISQWRELVAGDTADLPTEVRVEIVGRDVMPLAAVQASGASGDFSRVRTAFQLNGPSGSVIIDSGMDKAIAAKSQRGDTALFDEAAYGRIIAAMGVAARVAVTHEHWDHMGGVARFPVPERLAERLTLTTKQYEGLAAATADGLVPASFANAQRLDLKSPVRIAAGVVMIPAAGHTPGSVMFYVRLSDGREALFLGDIAWAISNITAPALRPRFVQQFFMSPPEDRALVADQVRTLHELSKAEPKLTMVPAHDGAHLEALIAQEVMKTSFVVEAP